MSPTVTPPEEKQRRCLHTTSKQGLGREAWAALLRVRTEPECSEGNLSELTWASNQTVGELPREKPALTYDTARPAHRTKD